MTPELTHALQHYVRTFSTETDRVVETLDQDALVQAAELILRAKQDGKRLHLSGIGKPSYVAGYGASLIASTGTPAYVLHGTEAVHGSAGQLVPGDVVILISNSGETAELLATAHAAKANGAVLIAITSNPDSSLAQLAEVHLRAAVENEGGPLNRAPRASIVVELFIVQALSVLLQADTDLSPEDYVRRHPGGALGQLRDDEA